MPEVHFITELRQQLTRRGCPAAVAKRILCETAEHLEDVREAARLGGRNEADDQMAVYFGDPAMLAERHVTALRHSAWWGRHPLAAFGLLPMLATPVLWLFLICAFCLGGGWLVLQLGYGGNSEAMGHACDNPVVFPWLWLGVRTADLAVIILITQFFCIQAGRTALDRRWMLLAGVLLALQGLAWVAILQPHSFSLCYAFVSSRSVGLLHWEKAAGPLLVTGLYWARSRWADKALCVMSDIPA